VQEELASDGTREIERESQREREREREREKREREREKERERESETERGQREKLLTSFLLTWLASMIVAKTGKP
jgi:hypothetical protein